MTPYELKLYAEEYNKKQVEEYKEKLTVAWQNAYWQRADKLGPDDLTKVLDKLDNKDEQEQSEEDMFEMVKKLQAKFGGNN